MENRIAHWMTTPIILFFGALLSFCTPYQLLGKDFAFDRNFDRVEAFEKIYVQQEQILCTPQGIFLKHADNKVEKVRAVLHDNGGRYVLRVITQCPMCGRCYAGKETNDGYCCPLYEKELLPGIWGTP